MSLPPRDSKTGLVRVIVDTPRGSRNKYKFDPELAVFKLSRVLPAGMSFPFDFGSIPGTCAELRRCTSLIALSAQGASDVLPARQ